MNKRYMVIVADDFGRSPSINRAIAEAHDRGIVTAASMIAGEDAFSEAVHVALARSRLSVGLHVTLCDGRSVLPHTQIPDLTDADGFFEASPAKAGLKYMRPGLRSQIEMEIEAQFVRLENAGIRLTHVDSHHHLHMHPVIFVILCRLASQRGIGWVRLPREPLQAILKVRSTSRGITPFFEWAVFRALGTYNMRLARAYGLRAACAVYGPARTGNIDENSLIDMVNNARGRVAEVFAHPDTATVEGRQELEALTSCRVRERAAGLGAAFVGYRELSGAAANSACAEEKR
ncbi:MAG: ChbG/HpnK family deacetylase [Nitrospirae bacterium]|nr:ChbG/HpnK family deacetylase [Nitrospirota bacterium]MCL5237985.1 ChbG/HpnK family deacetylase [Nitrospirota bacterium]